MLSLFDKVGFEFLLKVLYHRGGAETVLRGVHLAVFQCISNKGRYVTPMV